MNFAAKKMRPSLCLLAGIAWLSLTSLTVHGQGNAGPANLKHVVSAEPVFGSIRPRGYLPVRITIQRTGTQAVAQRDITYYIYQLDSSYRGNSYRTHLTSHRLVLPRGKTSVSGIFLMQEIPSGGWDSGIFVETDGNLRYSNRPGDIASIRSASFLNSNGGSVDASKVRCLFVSSATAVTPTQRFSFQDSAFGVGNPWATAQTSQLIDDTQDSDKALAASEVPAAWALHNVLEQENEVRYDPYRGTAQQSATALIPPRNPNKAENLEALRHFEYMDHLIPNELPEFWQAYVPIDYMFVSAAELKSIQSNLPTKWDAIRDWVAAGGRLVLVQCGPKGESLQAFERDWFELQPGEVRSLWKKTTFEKISASGDAWIKNSVSDPTVDPNFYGNTSGVYQQFSPDPGQQRQFISSNGLSVADCFLVAHCWNPKSGQFDFARDLESGEALYSNFGAGRIVATPGNYSNWDSAEWKTILTTGLAGAPGPLLAHNIRAESTFAFPATAMPGLGEPPWFLFLGMITIFAIGVGPVAYSILSARKKIPWILGLVPVVAGTLTVGLLVFAIVSEGLGTRAVRFSVTRMDNVSGRAFTKTHFTVYSGTSPGSYVFDDHKLVFPNLGSGYESRTSHYGDTQQFSGGGIRARTIHQLALAEPNQTDSQLSITKPSDDSEYWEVINQTGAILSPFVANTDDGWLILEQLDDGQTVELKPINSAQLVNSLGQMIVNSDHRLGQLELLKKELLGSRSRGWGRTASNNWDYYPDQRSWQAFGDVWLPGLMTNPAAIVNSVPVGAWLGMTDNWKQAGQLNAGTKYSHDFHLIHGRWK